MRLRPGHRGVVQKEGVPCRPPKEDVCAQHCPVAIETSSGRWVAGEGGGSGGGGGRRVGAGSWLLQFGRCRLPSQSAPEGTPRTESRARRQAPPSCALPRSRWPAGPSDPGLAQRGQSAPTCPQLGAQPGSGRRWGGCLEKSEGEWGPSTPAFLLVSPGSKLCRSVQVRADPRGSGAQGPALCTAAGLSPVCRLVSAPPYLLPCWDHRRDFQSCPTPWGQRV